MTTPDGEHARADGHRRSPASGPAVPWTYRGALVLVTAGVLVLPLLYVGLVLLVAGLTVWHTAAHVGILGSTDPVLVRLVLYLGPVGIGILLSLFLVKPLFIGPREKVRTFPFDPVTQPGLDEFIVAIADRVGVAAPVRVDLECDLNASAAFRGGLAGMRRGELVLTLGLPLVAGLTVGQLAGVLAHEFGHFAQAGGMRLTFLLRLVHHWFDRVVNQRDWLDAQLDSWIETAEPPVRLVLAVARAGIAASRRLLAALAWVARATSCVMLRRMEDDADRWEIRVAGSATFRESVLRLQELAAGGGRLDPLLTAGWSRGELPADLPATVVRLANRLGPDWHQGRADRLATDRTRLLDTHPCDADRLRAAATQAEPGVVSDDRPASSLFEDFHALCRELTRFHYEQVLGLDLSKVRLVVFDDLGTPGLDPDGDTP